MSAKEEAREAVLLTLYELNINVKADELIGSLRDRGYKIVKMQPKEMATHCVNGHKYTEESVYWHDGRKRCQICRTSRVREVRERARDE